MTKSPLIRERIDANQICYYMPDYTPYAMIRKGYNPDGPGTLFILEYQEGTRPLVQANSEKELINQLTASYEAGVYIPKT